MLSHDTANLEVGDTTARYERYAPQPIVREVTEVIQRLDPAVDDDCEPEPLPPVPARGSGTYAAVTVYPRRR
jgi:hypothetical protein